MATRYVPYTDDVEVREPDEDRVFDDIIASMGRQNRITCDRYRHAVRATHAKSHGVLKGELRVHDDLPEPLRQGLFKTPRAYPVVVRLASVPGEVLADGVSAQRGMAIKVIGVEGAPMLPGHENEVTQDFLFNNGSRFPVPDAAAFLKQQLLLEKSAGEGEFLKSLVSATARGANAALETIGLGSAKLDFFGHPSKHILADTFYSQAALRYGGYIAKLSVAPASENLAALEDEELDVSGNHSALRDAVVAFFKENAAEYELRVQLCTDLERMPIEDASVEWPEGESPYQPVARITLPAQEAYSPARRVYADDVLAFSPAHGLAEHRPLGSLMRARLKAYEPSARFRHEMNAQPRVEPRSIDDIPD